MIVDYVYLNKILLVQEKYKNNTGRDLLSSAGLCVAHNAYKFEIKEFKFKADNIMLKIQELCEEKLFKTNDNNFHQEKYSSVNYNDVLLWIEENNNIIDNIVYNLCINITKKEVDLIDFYLLLSSFCIMFSYLKTYNISEQQYAITNLILRGENTKKSYLIEFKID